MRAFFISLIFFFASSTDGARSATPDFRFLPAQIGDTVTLTYEVHSASVSTHELITLTRSATNRLTVTITPEGGAPVAFFQTVGDDGLLETAEPAIAEPAGIATATPLPRYPRGGDRHYGNVPRTTAEPSGVPRQASFTPQLPPQVAQIASMVVVASGPGSNQRTWTFANTPGTPPVKSTLTRTTAGKSTILVADGAGYGTAIHLECVFRDGAFVGARGIERAIVYGVDPSQQPATSFTLAAFATSSR